jgi:type IV fimbrial biogenesis protein FimT
MLVDQERTNVLRAHTHLKGFTLLELIVTLTVASILTALAIPNFSLWIANSRVRTSAEAMQNGLRLALSEAVRQNRRVAFKLTNNAPSTTATPAANGANWVIQTVPLITNLVGTTATLESVVFIQGGQFGNTAQNVSINSNGISQITFTPFGNVLPIAGIAFPLTVTFSPMNLTLANGSRPISVTINQGGAIRLCDTTKQITTSPDGC